jgi:Threonine dehydrogenase and related Zn-dependent dehydrogenases
VAGKIIAVDPYKFRTSLASDFGASEVVTSNDREEIKDNIKKLTNNFGADLVVDCTGVSEGFTIALELIREGGMVLEVGIFSNSHDIPINPHSQILEKSARVIGVGGDDISQYYPSIKILERNIDKLPWEKIISHNFQIEDVHEAMDVAMSDQSMKVILNP